MRALAYSSGRLICSRRLLHNLFPKQPPQHVVGFSGCERDVPDTTLFTWCRSIKCILPRALSPKPNCCLNRHGVGVLCVVHRALARNQKSSSVMRPFSLIVTRRCLRLVASWPTCGISGVGALGGIVLMSFHSTVKLSVPVVTEFRLWPAEC